MKVSNERLSVEQSDTGHWLVTLDHPWSDTQRLSFTVEIARGNQTVAELRAQAVAEVIRRLAPQ